MTHSIALSQSVAAPRATACLALTLLTLGSPALAQTPAFDPSAPAVENPLRAQPALETFPAGNFPTVADHPEAGPAPLPLPAVQPPAETVAPPPPGEQPTAAEVEARRKQAEEATDLAEDVKKKIADLYRLAAEHLDQAGQQAALAASLKSATENVPARVAQLRQELDALQHAQAQPPQAGSLSQLEQELAATTLQLDELKAAQVKLEAEPAARAARRKELRALITSAPARREELTKQLEAAPPAGEPLLLSLARRTELLARQAMLRNQPPVLQAELAKYDAEEASDLLRLERDVLARQVVLEQKQLELTNNAVAHQREADARDAVRQAQEEAIDAHPVLKTCAEENRRLAEEGHALAEKISDTQAKLKTARVRLEDVQKQMTQTQTKVENVGLTGAIGMMLRKQRTELPDVRRRKQNVALRQADIDAAQFALYEYDDQRSDLSTPERIVAEIVQSAGTALSAAQRRQLTEATENVLARRREYLDTLMRNYGGYFDALIELDTTERQLINVTRDYQNYIDERVLWIKSARPLYADFRLDESDYQLGSVGAWREIGRGLLADARTNFVAHLFAGVVFASLLGFNLRFRRDIAKQGEAAERGNCQEFLPTFRTALMTLMLVLPWPALMLFFAWRLLPMAGREGLAYGLLHGLSATALSYFLLRMARELCRSGGLGEAHFQWPGRATQQMRTGLRMLVVCGLPLIALAATMKGLDPEHGRDVLERSAMLLLSAMMIVFVGREFSPASGVFQEFLAYHSTGWFARLKHLWYGALLAVPVLVGGLSLFGYHYTARQLAARLYITATMVLIAVVARSMLLRLVLIARRKLAMLEARRRRQEQVEAATGETGLVLAAYTATADQPGTDLKTHSAQVHKLVSTALVAATLIGMWCVWNDVVPALGFLDRFALWSTSVQVSEQVVGSAGEAGLAATEKIMTVTLADVGLAVIIAIVTFVAAKNAPGLLEISVLRRLPLDNSVRYAITALSSYAIILVGVIVGCNTIGLRWSQIQWLATALTFGLAFGLQEMFANFIAGLIILFERPVRVGDVVTVDDTTGVVSRIRIRATTITNWDRKEYIVPNKEFITGKLLNWTLSDQVNRIMINVGVAYGSNTQLARELLLKVAVEHPLILDSPPTMATFEGFGDNSLNFTLRIFLPSMENRLPVINDLHMAIDKEFRGAGIEISFPQRDLHIRSISPEIAALAQDVAMAAAEQESGQRAA